MLGAQGGGRKETLQTNEKLGEKVDPLGGSRASFIFFLKLDFFASVKWYNHKESAVFLLQQLKGVRVVFFFSLLFAFGRKGRG